GLGSSTEASCCVERKIFLSPARASSSARTLASRPTINGVICCGKMTMSRTGIIGTRFISCFSRLNMRAPGLPKPRLQPVEDDRLLFLAERFHAQAGDHPAFSSKLQL